jgi:hypothetical protein
MVGPVAPLLVVAELGHRRAPRRESVPDRHRARHGLEVEEAERALERLEVAGEGRLDQQAVLLIARIWRCAVKDSFCVGRQVADVVDPRRQVGDGLLGAHQVQVADVERVVGPAADLERAVAGLVAVGAERLVGDGAGEGADQLVDQGGTWAGTPRPPR